MEVSVLSSKAACERAKQLRQQAQDLQEWSLQITQETRLLRQRCELIQQAHYIQVLCAWCGTPMGYVPCRSTLAGRLSHGMCSDCYQRQMEEVGGE